MSQPSAPTPNAPAGDTPETGKLTPEEIDAAVARARKTEMTDAQKDQAARLAEIFDAPREQLMPALLRIHADMTKEVAVRQPTLEQGLFPSRMAAAMREHADWLETELPKLLAARREVEATRDLAAQAADALDKFWPDTSVQSRLRYVAFDLVQKIRAALAATPEEKRNA